MFEVPEEDDALFDADLKEIGRDQFMPLHNVARIWAPDPVVDQLTGPYADFNTFRSIPRNLRAAPNATTWAGVELWLWWSPPTEAGYTNRAGDTKDPRVVCTSRKIMLYTVTMASLKATKAEKLPKIPPPIWLLIFGFLKHDEMPQLL